MQVASVAHVFSFMGGNGIRIPLYCLIPESVSCPKEEFCWSLWSTRKKLIGEWFALHRLVEEWVNFLRIRSTTQKYINMPW